MKIVVHGSYFGYNFGDTLLCKIFTDWVKENENVGEVILPLADARNLSFIGGHRAGMLSAVRADKAIFCGGGYFSAPSSSKKWQMRAFLRHLFLAEALRSAKVPIALLGVGVGPLYGTLIRERVKRLFSSAELVIVRDQQSKDYLNELGVKREVLVRTDAALSMDISKFDLDACFIKSRLDATKKRLFVHTSATPNERELQIVSFASHWASKRTDVQLVIGTDSLPRRASVTWPDMLESQLQNTNVFKYRYNGKVDDLVSLLSSVDGIVTTKLHVGIVGSLLEKFVISVPHHTKTPRFYGQIGLAANCVDPNAPWQEPLEKLLEQWGKDLILDFSKLREARQSSNYSPFVSRFVTGRLNDEI